jgi:2-oxo-4-hydroxy-4-carboxy-5-ureidoimidazoline decarboxylase
MQPIDELNAASLADFAPGIRPLFEAAPPLVHALYAERPFASYPELIDAADRLVHVMPFDDQVQVLAAHPRIGASAETVSAASYREQGYARESEMPPETVDAVYRQLAELNRAYEQRFGFRFVVFVNGRPKSAIVGVLQERLQRTPEDELHSGLHDMFLIARDRYASWRRMASPVERDDPARIDILNLLRQRVLDTYGSERAAEALVQRMLEAAATAVWRVGQESLEPSSDEP